MRDSPAAGRQSIRLWDLLFSCVMPVAQHRQQHPAAIGPLDIISGNNNRSIVVRGASMHMTWNISPIVSSCVGAAVIGMVVDDGGEAMVVTETRGFRVLSWTACLHVFPYSLV